MELRRWQVLVCVLILEAAVCMEDQSPKPALDLRLAEDSQKMREEEYGNHFHAAFAAQAEEIQSLKLLILELADTIKTRTSPRANSASQQPHSLQARSNQPAGFCFLVSTFTQYMLHPVHSCSDVKKRRRCCRAAQGYIAEQLFWPSHNQSFYQGDTP